MRRVQNKNVHHDLHRGGRPKRARWLAAAGVLAALLLFGSTQAADVSAVLMNGTIHTTGGLASAGFRSLGLFNDSGTKAIFTVYHLDHDTSGADVAAAYSDLERRLSNGDDTTAAINSLIEQAEPLSGVSVSAHSSEEMIVELETGTYAVVAAPTDGSEPSVATFRVIGGAERTSAPQVPNEVEFSDFAFDFPTSVDSGDILWKVSNTGEQPHVAEFYRLLPGKTTEDLLAYLNGDGGARQPYDDTATIETLGAGQTAFVPVDLDPGRWVVVCSVPDLANPAMTHDMEGMIAELRVD